jgi:hypothetical protein
MRPESQIELLVLLMLMSLVLLRLRDASGADCGNSSLMAPAAGRSKFDPARTRLLRDQINYTLCISNFGVGNKPRNLTAVSRKAVKWCTYRAC